MSVTGFVLEPPRLSGFYRWVQLIFVSSSTDCCPNMLVKGLHISHIIILNMHFMFWIAHLYLSFTVLGNSRTCSSGNIAEILLHVEQYVFHISAYLHFNTVYLYNGINPGRERLANDMQIPNKWGWGLVGNRAVTENTWHWNPPWNHCYWEYPPTDIKLFLCLLLKWWNVHLVLW